MTFAFEKPDNFDNYVTKIVLVDFNIHSNKWEYQETDRNGENVESWAEAESLSLVHDPKLPHPSIVVGGRKATT